MFVEPQPFRLLDLPAEVQRLILQIVFASTKLTCAYGAPYTPALIRPGRVNPPIYELDVEESLRLTQLKHIFAEDARVPWESFSTFEFPTTVAILDVLLAPSFPVKRRSLIRHMVVYGYPLPLYGLDQGSFTVHFTNDAIEALEGLQLETLEYRDICLRRNESIGGTVGYVRQLEGLLEMQGYRQLKVFSPDPRVTDDELDRWQHQTEVQRQELKEDNFVFEIHTAVISSSVSRRQISNDVNFPEAYDEAETMAEGRLVGNLDGTVAIGQDTSIQEETWPGEDVLVMTVRRCSAARVIMKPIPKQGYTPLVELLNKFTWHEIRRNGSSLFSECTGDPCGYLL